MFQPTTNQSQYRPLSQPTALQSLNPLASQLATYPRSHPPLPRSAAYQSFTPLVSQPAAHFRRLEMDPRQPQAPQLGGNQTSLPPPPLYHIVPRTYPPSLFSGGRLRGSVHYEAKLPDDTLVKFLIEASGDKERAAAVTSAKFSAVNDSLANTGLIPYFNETLRAYVFTDDNGDGDYPILTKAALRLRAYHSKVVSQQLLALFAIYTTNQGQPFLSLT